MPVLNYRTEIEARRTVGEIQEILAKHRVSGVMVRYEDGDPVELSFVYRVAGEPVQFRLPCNWQGVLKLLKDDPQVRASAKTKRHALRVSWRILKDWVEAQMAIVSAEMVTIGEVFLPYAVAREGRTLSEIALQNPRVLALTAGDG